MTERLHFASRYFSVFVSNFFMTNVSIFVNFNMVVYVLTSFYLKFKAENQRYFAEFTFQFRKYCWSVQCLGKT